ncbi:RNA polymerase sigma factor sigA-like isoform X2 [Magnolia sinica]|uniref:RNA polymerase sigma factor sigA-like isoform X2 n=1 Tax=Magnolia sinica TaxID=86752 RepID=UPI00265A857A|nr:RNA polymerase sigma factor sigA-like isoform X2 [Magnolia sinica]
MATAAAFIGLRATQFPAASTKNAIVAKKSMNSGPGFSCTRHSQSIKALEEHLDTSSAPSNADIWHQRSDILEKGESSNLESSLEALILLQKSMLEKQWSLSFEQAGLVDAPVGGHKKIEVTRSGTSARQRRTKPNTRKSLNRNASMTSSSKRKRLGPELQSHSTGYVKGTVSEDLLSHAEVIRLSKKIKAGLSLEEHKLKLKERLGCDPSDKQLASSLRISCSELRLQMIECSLARETLAMSNVRLVMSVAQKYDNMGTEIADLIQGGLISLLRGIEKFDSSKGFKISTYVYWWIRQGVSRALVENSRTLRLPTHLHERLILIRNAKTRLEEMGITPSIERISESLNMSRKKVRNATEAMNKVYSLDREAFPTLNGHPGETLRSFIADDILENNPWHKIDAWSLKEEVNKIINTTLGDREREIIRLYYGLDKECHTWEDIGKLIGLSRERVRQVGLAALEKLKNEASKRRLEAMLVKL